MGLISRRKVLAAALSGAALAAISGCVHIGRRAATQSSTTRSTTRRSRQRPNVIILLSSGQGYGDLSCNDHLFLRTPYLDALAKQSVRFMDFHSAPMASPTRAELLTGTHCVRNGAVSTCMGREMPRRDFPMLQELFAAEGYATGLFGKWQLGSAAPYRPMDRGFHEADYFNGSSLISADSRWNNDYYDPWFLHNGTAERGEGYCTDFFFERAMNWMRGRRDAGESFFAMISPPAPCFPQWVESRFSQPYEDALGTPGYYGMIANIDQNFSKLDAFLDDQSMLENTILVFTSDCGYSGGRSNPFNAGMRGGVGSRYDGGHRVSCFIRWPAGLKPCQVIAPAQVQDLAPTLVGLCGLKKAGADFDGLDLRGMVRGGKAPDRMLIVQYLQTELSAYDAAVIYNNWRLVNGRELYEITSDPGQAVDVAGLNPDTCDVMRRYYEKWWEKVRWNISLSSQISIGLPGDTTTVSLADWFDVWTEGEGAIEAVRNGGAISKGIGAWNVFAVESGIYEISLLRWPLEAQLALDAAAPAFAGRYGSLSPGQGFPIRAVSLIVDGRREDWSTRPGDTAGTFRVDLQRGHHSLGGRMLAANGQPLCGAMYAVIRRV
jgi:arylsulfatase A-like enzyme